MIRGYPVTFEGSFGCHVWFGFSGAGDRGGGQGGGGGGGGLGLSFRVRVCDLLVGWGNVLFTGGRVGG